MSCRLALHIFLFFIFVLEVRAANGGLERITNPLAQGVDGPHRFIVALLPLLNLCAIHRLPRLVGFYLLRQLLLGLRQLLLGLRQLVLQRRVEHDGRRHRLGLHLGEVNLDRRRLRVLA